MVRRRRLAFALSEEEFWERLEFRLGREFAGMAERRHRWMWCDGLLPDTYELDGERPRISGEAWIVNGREPYQWRFTLLLPEGCRARGEIDWFELLPRDDVTCWMSFDEGKRYLEMEPGVARGDLG